MLRKPSEIIIYGKSLEKILNKHKNQLILTNADLRDADLTEANLSGADLTEANLSGADLRGVDLTEADLRGAELRYADLTETDLRYADLTETDLRYADLTKADLKYADLRGADLKYADLRGADLTEADLTETNLRGANLTEANLRGTNLSKVKYNHVTTFLSLQCPEEGSFIGYKKANNKIVKLLILEDSKRSSATSRKCRCDKAKVLDIESLDGKEKYTEARSNYDSNFIYKVGEIVKVDNFCEDRWKECAPGIHFFITKQEAISY